MKFVNPEIDIQKIDIEDIITTSTGDVGGGAGGENELPM